MAAAAELATDETVLAALEPLVAKFRQENNLELEVRLGQWEHGRTFQPGVSYEYSQALFKAMTEDTPPWTSQSGIVPFIDKSFENNIRARFVLSGKEVIQSIYRHVLKSDHVDVLCPARMYGLRFALKYEIPLRKFTTFKPALHVRCTDRITIQDHAWHYDFSKTSQGKSTEEACQSGTFDITVELELQRNENFLSQHTDREIAIMFLGRARDLLGRYNTSNQRESLPVQLMTHAHHH